MRLWVAERKRIGSVRSQQPVPILCSPPSHHLQHLLCINNTNILLTMEFEELWTIGTLLMGVTVVATFSGIFYHTVVGSGIMAQNLVLIGFALFVLTVAFTVVAVVKVYTQQCRLRYRRKSLKLDD